VSWPDINQVTLGGEVFTLRPSYAAARDIEGHTSHTISDLLDFIRSGKLKYQEAVMIVYHGAENKENVFTSVDAVGASIFEEKITSAPLLASLSQFLLSCLYVPQAAKKKFAEDVEPLINPTTSEAG